MISLNMYILPHTIAAIILIITGLYSIRYRNIPMAVPFGLLMFSASLWCIFYSLEIVSTDFWFKLLWTKARFFGLAPLSTLWLVVAIQHIDSITWFRGPRWLILAIVPVAVIVLSMTSSHHTLFRYNYQLLQNEGISVVLFKNGPLFAAYAIYSYIMAIFSGIILYRSFRKRDVIRRRQTILVISAIGIFIIVDILYQTGITPVPHYNLSSASLAISGILLAMAVFRYRILDLAPITRVMVMNGIKDIILVADDTGRLLDFNRSASKTFGLSVTSSTGMMLSQIHPVFSEIHKTENGRSKISGNKHVAINGMDKTYEFSIRPVFFSGGQIVGTLVHLRDVTAQKNMEKEIRKANAELLAKIMKIELLQTQLQEQAIRDPLTGLYNRRYMDETIDHDFSLAVRNGLPISFSIIDIDYFKAVNDTWGHQAGDELLKSLARLLMEKVRKSDMVCRYGGEEFLVVLNGISSEQAVKQIEILRSLFEGSTTQYKNLKIRATFSAGVAAYPEDGNEVIDLIRSTDVALYRAKREGRNRVMK